jgi:hypothetical protein
LIYEISEGAAKGAKDEGQFEEIFGRASGKPDQEGLPLVIDATPDDPMPGRNK